MTPNSSSSNDKPVKDKIMTARIYPETFEKFSRINRIRGMSNNSVINMIISDYIEQNEKLLNK